VETRTPTRPQKAPAEGIDAEPGLYGVKVPTDPARLNTTTASFRVRLSTPVNPLFDAPLLSDDTQQLVVPGFPAVTSAGLPLFGGQPLAPAQPPRRKPRVTPITWTGGAAPLLDAVRQGGGPVLPRQQAPDVTQTLSRLDPDQPGRSGLPGAPGYPDYLGVGGPDPRANRFAEDEAYRLDPRDPAEPVRHAWYPGRRVDLGLVLLPLRLFLGGISIYAGFSKLCDPVYFNGGARGSMMHWLQSLHPWPLASPLLDQALTHPVGAGLGVAFAQIVVGVLCVLGLWQRFAAAIGMALALVLLVTVSWRSAPVYDAPQIIYLAAWSPLLLAGAPLFSLDGRLAIEAWRRLGERAPVSRLRRRVLRRGFVVAVMVVGSTLLLGSALGATVRSSRSVTTVVPDSPALPTLYPNPMWPTLTPSAHPGSAKPSATRAHKTAHSPRTSPTSQHSASTRHHGGNSAGGGATFGTGSASSTGTGTGGSSAGQSSGSSSGSGSGSSAPAPSTGHHHRTGSPSSGPSSGNGVLGGLLG
jgi:uncharacterized membrane protein YphA (DoxX/SURF4 family)